MTDAPVHQGEDALAALHRLGLAGRMPAIDSRRVRGGEVFLAYPGERGDGRTHIAEALRAGAAGVLWEGAGFAWDPAWLVPNAPVAGLREQAGPVAAAALGDPSARLWMAGVTGTNGKTSCSHWIAAALGSLGRPAGVVGTLGNGVPGRLLEASHTTPDPVSLQQELARQAGAGLQACAMEVSSHALDQGRVNGVRFRTALFTNLTRDHLDYHGSMEAYGQAKARLFRMPGLETAVVNIDDPFGRALADALRAGCVQVLGYGLGAGDIAGRLLAATAAGLQLAVDTPQGCCHVDSRLLGRFNARNLLGVLGVLLAAGFSPAAAADALAALDPVRGRLQRVQRPGSALVVVDYAHTPDALEQVLGTLRELVPAGGRLICVFGCGGERDAGKRPLMGAIAARLADRVILTSDNPRGEDPARIIGDILRGAVADVEADRAAAIALALRGAGARDVVLVAGKGHETWQEVAGQRHPFDDAAVAARILDGGPAGA